MIDFETIKSAGKGCDESFREVLKKYQGSIKHFCRVYLKTGAEYDDLFQGGLIGLLRTCRKSKCLPGFSRYLEYHIRDEMNKVVEMSRRIYLPGQVTDLMSKIHTSGNDGGELLENDKNGKYVRMAMQINSESYGDMDSFARDDNPNDKYYIPRYVKEVLSDKELDVIILTVGLYGGEPLSFVDAAEILKVSKSTVHDRHCRAVGKLRDVIVKRGTHAPFIDRPTI